MAGPYFVDPRASGGASGADWTNAFTSLAAALAVPPAAGEIIYCRKSSGADEVISSGMAMSSSGTNSGGWIKIIGCNSSGVVDGTRYVIDANGGSFHILDFAGQDIWLLENIEVKNNAGTNHGFYNSTGASSGNVLVNCCANNTYNGFRGRFDNSLFFRSVAYSNRNAGFSSIEYNTVFMFCCSRDNTNDGFSSITGALFFGCISSNNTDGYQPTSGYQTIIINSVVDGNVDRGVVVGGGTQLFAPLILIANRITNHSGSGDIGLEGSSEPIITGWNYFENNYGDNMQNVSIAYNIPLEGGSATSNIEDGVSVDDCGYVDSAGNNFATNYDATDPDNLRRKAITIPWS